MASVQLINVNKVYDGGVHAVHDFSIDIKDREFIVFVGPSGCGKSTTLRMIAGLEEISYGDFLIDGKIMNSAAPKDRDIAMVFQSYALYPQMTVYNNMAYALKLRKVPKEEIDKRVREAAKILKLTPYLDRKPRALSGGQRQRVALGRSIVRRPKVFLMDEPLSNLDAKLRVAMRSEIVRIHEEVGATTIYVTHDQIEAMTMASRIVVMKDGYIQQIGEPNEVYKNPANMFVAGFIGTPAMNFLHGSVEKGYFVLDGSGEKLKLSPAQKKMLKNYEGKRIVYGIRPENLVYEQDEKFEKFAECSFNLKVGMVELLGDIVNVHGEVGGGKAILKMSSKYSVKDKSEIKVAVDFEHARFFNETTTKAITEENNEYEEVEVVQSLDDDNVVIVEQKPQGLIAKAVGAIKSKVKKDKPEEQPPEEQAEDGDNPNSAKPKPEAAQSRFTGGAFKWGLVNLGAIMLTLATLGICYPFAVCWKLQWQAEHTYINGRRQVFDGTGAQLFGKYMLWWFLSLITLGIYFVLCGKVNILKWQTKHTHFEDATEEEKGSTFTGKWYQVLGVNLLTGFVSLITLSFGSYWAHCYKLRWENAHKTIDGKTLVFNGTAMQYFCKRIVWVLLTIITVGIYGFWLAVKSKQWTVSHLAIDGYNAEQPEEVVSEVAEEPKEAEEKPEEVAEEKPKQTKKSKK